jgi:hypothetical protein
MNRTAARLAVAVLPVFIGSLEPSQQASRQTRADQPAAIRGRLPPTAERAYRAVAGRFDDREALAIAAFMDQFATGVPSLFNWHFTDRYYHTNQDRLDKVSAAEMKNVGVAVATSAWLLASADERDALAVTGIIAEAATRFAPRWQPPKIG